LAAKPDYDHTRIFDENLVAVHMKKTELVFNNPVHLGMSILDIQKTLMYDFHYNYMKKYGEICKLLTTDTDSLTYQVETEDFYKEIKNDVSEKFNASNFPESHQSDKPKLNKKFRFFLKAKQLRKEKFQNFVV